MLRRSVIDRTAASASSGVDEPGYALVACYAGAVHTYVTRVCGTDAAETLTRRALIEVARVGNAGMSAPEAASVVSRSARAVALAELERAARRPDRRAKRLLALRRRCVNTPALLRARAESEISTPKLDGLYRHLDRCEHCAHLAGRCDSAEWYLGIELVERGRPSSYATGRADGQLRSAAAAVPIAGHTSAPPRAEPQSDGALAQWSHGTADGMGPLTDPRARTARPPVRRLLRPRAVGALVLLLLVAAAIALTLSRVGGGRASRTLTHAGPASHSAQGRGPASAPAASGTPVTPGAPAASGTPVTPGAPAAPGRGLRTPFVAGGARYAVFRNPQQSWTGFLHTDAGKGLRWEAVTVRVRNMSMTGFDPRVLKYRLVDSNRAAFTPEPTLGTAPALGQPRRPLAAGELVESRLGFRVPSGAAGLRLLFRPSRGGPLIVVSLGQ